MITVEEVIEHTKDDYYILKQEYISNTLDQYPSKSGCIYDFEREYGTEKEYVDKHYDEVKQRLLDEEEATSSEAKWECDNER